MTGHDLGPFCFLRLHLWTRIHERMTRKIAMYLWSLVSGKNGVAGVA